MNNCSFFRLLKEDEKGSHLAGIVKSIRNNQEKYSAFLIETTRFRKVPGSPFAYWISEKIRDIFHDYPKFDSNGVTAKGLSTSDDFRFIRTWWEVNPHAILSGTEETTQEQFVDQTYHGKTWVPCTKGGDYSPYYADIHLVANWKENGQEMKSWVVENPNDPGTTHWSRNIRSPELYFNPGLTWTHRTTSPIGFRILLLA